MSHEIVRIIGEEIAKAWCQDPIFWGDYKDVAKKIYRRIKPLMNKQPGDEK